MFGWLGQSRDKKIARDLYDGALTAARQPALYTAIGIADTIEGRFEMLALHLAALLERLAKFAAPDPRLATLLTETFVVDMDDAMRAHGVGDLTVPKKVKKAAAALYDRHRAYRQPLSANAPQKAWHEALSTQLQPLKGRDHIDIDALARYASQLAPHLAAQTDRELATGQVTFPTALAS